MTVSALLAEALRDLEIAEQAIAQMAQTDQFTAFQREWQNFLFRIERAWEKAERTVQGRKQFQQWYKPYAQQRKSDPLLVFLRQARHAETHAVSPTLDKPVRLVIRDKFGHPFRLERIKQTLENGTLTIDIDTAAEDALLDYQATLVPTSPLLIRFRNKGRFYDPPESHLGRPIAGIHPVDAAKLGLAFYGAFVKEASFRFSRGDD